jgi:SAM-dependent methyltransferase
MATTHRYDRSAARYLRWWAPVLEASARELFGRVAEALDGRPPGDVLDVGTGTGVLARAAASRWPDARVVGLDASRAMLDAAEGESNRLLDPADRRRMDWRTGLAESLPFGDAAFDLVVSSFVYQLVPDRMTALGEAARVLRPGGRLAYITWMDAGDAFEPQTVFDDLVDEERLDEGLPPEDDRSDIAGDVRSPRAAAGELRRAGFRDVRARETTLEFSWTRQSYLEFLVRYDASDIFETLTTGERRRVVGILEQRFAELPDGAFTWRTPLVWAMARKPGG